MDFTIEQIIEITGARVLKSEINQDVKLEISTDTRTINSKKIFIPLVGANFDGHDFIDKACESGALGYLTQKEIVSELAKFVLLVENTLVAYLKLANYYKNKISPKTIAITGSAGKTTTKEMAYYVFSQKFKTHKSELNHNNEIGLAQTLLSMPNNTEALIVEMGMRGLGEIELLSKFAEPDLAIIANIGSAHIGRLGSYENIAKAKFEITKYLSPDGILIANKNQYLDAINNIKDRTIEFSLESNDLNILEMTSEYSRFMYKNYEYKINLSGEYNIQNALSIIEAATYYKVEKELIAKGLEEFKPIQNRWQIEKVFGADIINDAYNANPESMIATIKNFLAVYDGRKILVLGDMGELGEKEVDFHAQIGEELNNLDFDLLITVGNLSKNISDKNKAKSKHFNSIDDCCKYLKNQLMQNDRVLLKASRSMELETIIKKLKDTERIEL